MKKDFNIRNVIFLCLIYLINNFAVANADTRRLLEPIVAQQFSQAPVAAAKTVAGSGFTNKRSAFRLVFYAQWGSNRYEWSDDGIRFCEFPELEINDKSFMKCRPVSRLVPEAGGRTFAEPPPNFLLNYAVKIDNQYSGSGSKKVYELGSADYERRIANTIEFYDKELGGILDLLIKFVEWEDPNVRASYLRSTPYSEKRRNWLCKSVFNETAEKQRTLISTSTTSNLDFCNPGKFWTDLANSVSLEPDLLKNHKFSERWIPAKYLSFEKESYDLTALNVRYDITLKHGTKYDRGNLKALVKNLLSHVSLSVLFTSQSYSNQHDFSEWREKLEKLANDFFFKDISSKEDIEKRIQMATYTEEYYEFLAFLANVNTQRERSIFTVYKDLIFQSP
ncbi:hypothetical protein N8199_08825 [Emcibacteraceae bacterium]|nr:hypothetical protein [Emcibacteraceae bacterium]